MSSSNGGKPGCSAERRSGREKRHSENDHPDLAHKRAEEELRQQKNLLNHVLESAGQGIVAYDSDFKIIASNKNYISMWPQSIVELLKLGTTLYDVVHRRPNCGSMVRAMRFGGPKNVYEF
jgi:PAS domain-containing protein